MKERLKTLAVAVIGFFLMWAAFSAFLAVAFRHVRSAGTPFLSYLRNETLPSFWGFFSLIIPAGPILASIAVIGWLLYELSLAGTKKPDR